MTRRGPAATRHWTSRQAAAAGVTAVLMLSTGGAAVLNRNPVHGQAGRGGPAGTGLPSRAAAVPTPAPPVKLDRRALTRAIDRYLDHRPGSVSLVMRDLTTGNTFKYRPRSRYATASCAKVDILMTLLLQAKKSKRKPSAELRRQAGLAIRYSDNAAADLLWEQIDGAAGMTAANRKFGLKRTRATEGKCIDLYCWGITDTTADEQAKLLWALVDEESPLAAKDRQYVLGLMGKVTREQAWGISAAARKGDKVALKNGWQKRLAHGGLWAINSIGRVQTPGHDFLIAVLSDHNPDQGRGITSIERVVELAAKEFRKTRGRS